MIRRLAAALGGLVLVLTALVGTAVPAQAACWADSSYTSKSFSTTSGSVNLQISTYYDNCGSYVILKSFRVTISGPAGSIHTSKIRYYSGANAVLVASRSGTFYDGSTYSLSRIRCNDTCTGVYTGYISVTGATDPKFTLSDALT
jgi:hypothetical protein